MYHKLCNLGYARENVKDERFVWKQIGQLYYDPDISTAKVKMYGFRQGVIMGKCDGRNSPKPLIHGDLRVPCDAVDGIVKYLYIGHMTTTVNDKDEHAYTIDFYCVPCVPVIDRAMWIEVFGEDKGYHREDEYYKEAK